VVGIKAINYCTGLRAQKW